MNNSYSWLTVHDSLGWRFQPYWKVWVNQSTIPHAEGNKRHVLKPSDHFSPYVSWHARRHAFWHFDATLSPVVLSICKHVAWRLFWNALGYYSDKIFRPSCSESIAEHMPQHVRWHSPWQQKHVRVSHESYFFLPDMFSVRKSGGLKHTSAFPNFACFDIIIPMATNFTRASITAKNFAPNNGVFWPGFPLSFLPNTNHVFYLGDGIYLP